MGAHVRLGQEPTAITQNKFFFLPLLVISILTLVFWAQPAFAHEPPVILPTQLDFDASKAPKKCNDEDSFRTILSAWVPLKLLREDAERRLVVRIVWSATGGKRADVSLVDAQGVVVAEQHTPYAPTTECYKVLWEVARGAAKMLGAFEPPPPKEPMTCPTCPPASPIKSPSVSPTLQCPTCPRPISLLPTPPRFFVGLGAFVGSGIFSELRSGPQVLFGLAPLSRLPQVQLELESSWTSQSIDSVRVQAIPVIGSACWVRGIVRFCGGLALTILSSNQFPNQESRMLGPNVRMGAELFERGQLSIRADVFGRVAARQNSIGVKNEPLDRVLPFTAGMAVMGMWAAD